MKIIIVSGGFDPIHSGHIELLKKASSLGDMLIVGLNSDDWLCRKKGRSFLPVEERRKILESIKWVDQVWEFDDYDNTACALLSAIKDYYTSSDVTFTFANGGDRTQENIPEMNVSRIDFLFGIGGGDKKNSSSLILEEWKSPKTIRPWGYYRVLHDVDRTKVKELVVNPGSSLSMQRHNFRSEYWHVTEGCALVNTMTTSVNSIGVTPLETLYKHQSIHINRGKWHQLTNPFVTSCKIIEIQYGEKCIEDDIERL